MAEKEMSKGKLAYTLFNKVGATEKDKARAKEIIEAEDAEALDAYGKFVRAEIIFWGDVHHSWNDKEAFETFQKMVFCKSLPIPLLIGACFHTARCYELGFGVGRNLPMAYKHYCLTNILNPKACRKDIARLKKLLDSEPKRFDTHTPKKYQYACEFETTFNYEYYLEKKMEEEWKKEFVKRMRLKKKTGNFYEDDPEEVNVDEIDNYEADDSDDLLKFFDSYSGPIYDNDDEADFDDDDLLILFDDDDDD